MHSSSVPMVAQLVHLHHKWWGSKSLWRVCPTTLRSSACCCCSISRSSSSVYSGSNVAVIHCIRHVNGVFITIHPRLSIKSKLKSTWFAQKILCCTSSSTACSRGEREGGGGGGAGSLLLGKRVWSGLRQFSLMTRPRSKISSQRDIGRNIWR